MASPTVFNETKNALLRYYASVQSSQSARLIGFSIALFTLLQTVQHSQQEPLAGIFKDLGEVAPTFGISPSVGDMVKLVLFSSFVWLLIVFIVRTIFRFQLFTYSADHLIALKLTEISEDTHSIYSAINQATFEKVCERKVYGIFPLSWFIARGTGKKHIIGLILCMFLAFLATSILMWLLW